MIAHLRTTTVSLVLDLRGPGLPAVAHWGGALGAPTDDDLAALDRALASPLAVNAVDPRVPVALLPDAGAGHAGRPGLRGHRDGRDWCPSFTLAGTDTAGEPDGERTVAWHAVDERAGLELGGELELAASGVLRMRQHVRNAGGDRYTLDGLEMALPLPAHATEVLDLTGRWCRERHPQRHPLAVGTWLREGRRGRTGHDATTVLLAGTAGFANRHGEVWALHVGWSGNHVSYVQRLPEGPARIGGGELLLSGEVVLEPGERYTSPWVYAAYSDRGLDGISAALHGWLRARARHPAADRPRPVVLNTWEAVYFDQDPAKLRDLASAAALAGVERFVLDDGWFRHRRSNRAGLGDWYVDRDVWPDGLGPLIDHVGGLGMDFGLWVEPEMVNPDSDLCRAHPDWVLGPAPGALPPSVRNQQVLDLTRPDPYAYVLGRLDRLLADHDIAYLKWDHNRDLVGAGSAGRAAVHAQTAAAYRLLDDVRARHPHVEIESCSSGGARIDLGILERTDRVWASDCNDALERQAIQRWTGLLVPPELLGAHVGPPRAHTTGRTHDLSFRLATALFGHLGIEWDLLAASPEEQAALASGVALYKELRGLLHGGEAVHADHPDPAAALHGVVAADQRAALYSYVQLATSDRAVPAPMRLPGLDPDRSYRVHALEPAGPPATVQRAGPPWLEDGGVIVLPGRLLARAGLQPPILQPEQAMLVHLTDAT